MDLRFTIRCDWGPPFALRIICPPTPAMYGSPYPLHDHLRNMQQRSHIQPDVYPQQSVEWQMLAQQRFADLQLPPQPVQSPHVPSPLSTPSNAGGNSPVDYFSMQSMAPPQQQQWPVPPYQGGLHGFFARRLRLIFFFYRPDNARLVCRQQ